MSRLIIGILLITTSFISTVNAVENKTYSVGVVPQFDVRKIRKIWQPILDELQADTGHKFVLKGSPTIPKFETEFNEGQFDFAYMNPYHMLLASKSQGYSPLVRDVGRQLFGVLVVKKEGPIKELKDLEGKVVAFPAPNALGASLMIRAALKENHNINIIPRYVKTHSSVYLNVALGQAAAGGGVQKTLGQQPGLIKSSLHIIYKTKEVAPHPFVAHPRVDSGVKNKVIAALLKLGKTEKGRGLLKNIPIKKIGKSSIDDYSPLKEMGLDKYYIKQ